MQRIALLDKDAARLSEVASSLRKIGCAAIECEIDLTDENSILNVINKLYSEFDNWNVLVTAAGLFVGGALTDIKGSDWDRLIAIN